MKQALLAAALAASAVIAVPTVAGLAQDPDPPAGATTPLSGGGQAMPAAPEMGAGPEMMHHMWMRRMMPGGDPQQRCIDRLAWRAARRAYVESKLDLTAAQRPLWAKVENAAQAEEQKERQLCDALKSATAPTFVDRMDRLQQFLAARLEGLRAAQPAITALYQALTPAQRTILDHPFRRS